MKKIIIYSLSILLLALSFSSTGCFSIHIRDTDSTKNSKSGKTISYEAVLSPKEITPFSKDFSSGLNRFGFELLMDLDADENIAVSPASIELALLMTAMGATENTKDEMIRALSMDALSDEEIRLHVGQLMWRANQNGMEAANSLWPQENYGFSDSFLQLCAQDFMADIFLVDYRSNSNGVTRQINQWASDKTHKKIPQIIDEPLDPSTSMVLVNALYFLGDWASPFEANNTYDKSFYGANGETTVPFMYAERYVPYKKEADFQMILLPFRGDDGKAGPFAMAFLLPKVGASPKDVAQILSETDFSDIVDQADSTLVYINLPKFEFEYGTSMVDSMKRLGMNDAFGESARFDEMTGGQNDLYISDILHKTYVRIDEKGAEAAAVTAVIMKETSAMIEEEVDYVVFTADRPFLFAIYDTTDGTVLFTGITANIE